MTAKLFQFAAILQPKFVKGEDPEPAKLIVPVTTILAKDDATANMMAARAIPEEHVKHLDRIEVAVRPF